MLVAQVNCTRFLTREESPSALIDQEIHNGEHYWLAASHLLGPQGKFPRLTVRAGT